MSNPTTVAARSVPFAVSADGNTYKTAVCKKLVNLNVDMPVTQEESDCSVHTSTGTAKWAFDVELILNTTPNGATEMAFDTMLAWALAGTGFYVKTTSGGSYYRQGFGYISNWRESLPQGGLVTVTFTFTGDGTLDITA